MAGAKAPAIFMGVVVRRLRRVHEVEPRRPVPLHQYWLLVSLGSFPREPGT
jgi:hypothetical protein